MKPSVRHAAAGVVAFFVIAIISLMLIIAFLLHFLPFLPS
jgi:hypothetical protein